VTLDDGSVLHGTTTANPRVGGDLWTGENDAAEFVRETVEAADGTGRLRAILDAVRSHRVEDDFSNHWTYAREDFERKLYRKRAKVKVRFVELTDTIPVQGPETDIVDRLVFNDFLALLDPREREVVVLLRSGTTKLTEIADIMGYRNHSPISKRLKHIRDAAARFFEEG
jgi:DNA-directed RNA polymerase specialized sigma24 family protein